MDLLEITAFVGILVLILIVAQITKHTHATPTSNQINRNKRPKSDIDVIFSNVVDFLKSADVYFRYGKNKKEKDYQQDLDQKLDVLKYKYGYEKTYESYQEKHRVDFIVDNTIGIEIKVYRGGSQVKKELFYQISEYHKFCKKMIALVINLTEEDNYQIEKDIRRKLKEVMDTSDFVVIVKSTLNTP